MADVADEFVPHVSIPYENTFAGVIDAIAQYYGKDSVQYEAINQYGLSNPAASKVMRQMGYDVTVNGKGEVLAYTKKGTAISSTGEKIASDIINSNNQTGTHSASNVTNYNMIGDVTRKAAEAGAGAAAEKTLNATAKMSKWVNGVKQTLDTPLGQIGHVPVAGHIGPAILAAQTGIKLAHVVDGSIYHIGKAMGADPPESLNPDSWASITSDMSNEGWEGVSKWAFNTIFDIDTDNKTATMYADENAVSYMAWYLQHAGWFTNTGFSAPADINPDTNLYNYTGGVTATYTGFNDAAGRTESHRQELKNSDWILCGVIADIKPPYGDKDFSTSSKILNIMGHRGNITKSLFNATEAEKASWLKQTNYALSGVTDNNIYPLQVSDFYYQNGLFYHAAYNTDFNIPIFNSYADATNYFNTNNYDNAINRGVDGVEQGKTADGQTAKNYDSQLADADSQEKMLELLKTLYPELWDNRIENTVAQDDGTEKTFVYIPLPMPTGGTGDNPEGGVVPDAGTIPAYGTGTAGATDTQIGTLIKWLTQTLTPTGEVEPDPTGTGQPDYDPTGMVNPKTGVDPETGTPTTGGTQNPPDTGGGDTPVVVLPEGHANALYAIYNPTQSQLNSLGAWLWSSDFVDQLLKLFSDPMQAIIGLHKIYATPATGGEQNIKVGFLDSGVSSKIVTDQYTTVDCGSVNLFEYFGNVFDYAPYTQLRLYLPFIGIVNLDTEDAMRGVIHVVYHVDVLSGACLAEVRITRDAAGGTLYQYAGNAAVTMPISSGSYIGVIANVVGVASSAIGGFASGGVAGGIAGGVTGALTRRGGTQVQHSGNFSGNAGAMGIKKPYLIIERPQTALADNYAEYIGNPSNTTVTLSSCAGYIKMKEVHLENVPATGAELSEIEQTLKQGVII